MTKFASIMFRIVGVMLLIWTILGILSGGLDFDWSVFFLLMDGLVGLLLLYMGKSMKKLAKIEDKLDKYVLSADHLSKPLCKCEKCNKIYDSDVEQCPYCELERLKLINKYK